MAQQSCEPPSLPVGTEVSAKYRGAFCEAKVKTVTRVVKCKVLMKDCQSSVFVTDDEIKGPIKVAAVVEVKHPDTGQPVEATITKLIDNSTYTVVFDDGDERTLRRTQLCLKGDKHFIESETLDNLPLSHPEHFGTPVLQSKKSKRKNGEDSDDGDDASEGESPRRTMYRGRHQELVGKLMLIELPQRKGSMLPVLVVLPDANSLSEVKSRDQILVRSFKDSKFMTVTRKDLKEFSRPVAINNEDKTTRAAFEKALLYFDAKELPVGWDKEEMLGSDVEDDDSNDFNDEYASEDEPFEEKDRFVAQLYKFMDDRGTPINKGPCIGNKDLNLYKLFKIVQALGGYNKVTKEMKWPVVYSRMSLPSLHQNPAHQIKTAYKKYLDAYETFYRKLGSTMGTLSRPGRVRQNSGRNILNFRGREKSPRSPKTTVDKNKDEADISKTKTEPVPDKSEETQDSASVTSIEDNDVITRRSTPRRENRTQSTKEEKKDESKDKKEDTAKHKKDEKKEESAKVKKEEATKGKKDDSSSTAKIKKEEAAPVTKTKKEDKIKKEDDPGRKEERKSSRKVKVEEDADMEEKKPSRALRKAEEEKKEEIKSDSVTEGKESPKKRITRRKLMQNEAKKEEDSKEENVEGKKEIPKKVIAKDVKVSEKKEKDIPRTLERRDIKLTEKKEALLKEKKETKVAAEKKVKVAEDKKPQRKEKKGKEGKPDEDDTSPNNNAEEAEVVEPETTDRPFHYEYPVGSKLRVKYGRGKNQKIYNAKVVDYGKDGNHMTYLVHYAGWNMRYDEWIRADRVVSVLDKPEAEQSKPPVLKQTGTLAGTLKKLGTSTQNILKKTGQIFRAPKTITTKTRATRSSSLETRIVPKKSGKRITRRGSIAASSESSESDKSADAQDSSTGVKPDEVAKSKEDQDQDEMDVDVEEEEDVAADVLKEKINTDSEESESVSKEECVYSETGSEKEEERQEEAKEYDTKEEKIPKKDTVVGKTDTTVSSETCSDSVEEDTEIVIDTDKETEEMPVASKLDKVVGDSEVPEHKAEKVSIAMTEVNTAVDEIRSVVEDENVPLGCDESENAETTEVVKEADIEKGKDSSRLESNSNVSISGKESREGSSEVEDVLPQNVLEEPGVLTLSEDQGIPQLKKIVLELEGNEKEADQSKTQKGKKKEGLKDSKRSIRTLDMTGTSLVQEIPTLEPMPLFSEGRLSGKAASSPYDFDAETDSSWHPEITKKWEPACKSQTPAKENLSVAEDGNEKEKKKVKKKTKKKPISPEFVVEAKGDDVSKGSGESSPAQTTDDSGVPQSRTDGETEKPTVKKKGRKKKEIAAEAKKEVIQQYENVVNSVVQAVKHIVQKAEDEEEQRPAPKKRKTKRVSESDRKDVKIGRRKNSKDTLDSLEDSRAVVEPGRTDYISSSESQTSNESIPAQSQLADVPSSSSFAACEDNLSKAERKESTFSESQGFEVQLEPHDSNAPFDNTPPTTPEHDEAEEKESGTALHQHHGSNLTSKPDYLKDNAKAVCSSSSSSLSLPTSTGVVQSKSASESPSDNDVISTTSIDNLDTTLITQQSESSSGTDQDAAPAIKKRKAQEESGVDVVIPKKKKRVHGTRSRTARKSPKYIGSESGMTFKNTDSQVSSSATPNHCPESPPTKFVDFSKSPRSSKYNFSADLGEYLEGEAKCTFLIEKMKEIKSIYMSLKAEVASIDRRRKRARRKEREVSQATSNEREGSS